MSEIDDEVVIIEEDDLEEGEITNDSDSEIEVIRTTIKPKKLPKRYNLQDRKVSNEKHKKDCKYAYHSNHKVKDKNKSTVTNVVYKKHKSSCPLQHQKSSKGKPVSQKHSISPNLTKSLNNHNSTLKSAFRNFTSPPRPVLKKNSPDNKQDTNEEDTYPELLLAYKKCREQLSHKRKSGDFDYRDEHSPSKKSTRRSFNDWSSLPKNSKKQSPKEKISPIKNVRPSLNDNITNENKQPLIDNTPIPEAIQVDDLQETNSPISEEESEDEEELRRIALATCVKRTLPEEKAIKNSNSSVNSSPTHSLSNHSSVTLIVNGDNNSSDNHDVVDMDLDDENFVEDVDNNLFVIDNTPLAPSQFNQYLFYEEPCTGLNNLSKENYVPPKQELPSSIVQFDEEFEEAILRAEGIASMAPKKISSPETSRSASVSPELINKVECLSPQDQFLKPPGNNSLPLQSGHSINAFEANVQKIEVVKLSHSKFPKLNKSQFPNSKKVLIPKPRNINTSQNRLVITLNNDSSSEESDEAEDPYKLSKQEIVGASSIDALISKARQKSDIKANGTNINNVSCLSKAQQEEYKKLRNLLAEKEPMTIIPQVLKEKIAAEQQGLNFLTNKITVAKEKLDKEVEVLSNAEKEVLNKKKVYISSKLKFQHLQEQLHAAKLTKTANLKAWKVNEAKLANAKSSCTKQKALIALLETEFTNRRLQFEQNSSPLFR